MLLLVSGGAGSGKSEYAEGLLAQRGGDQRIYLATMECWDEEDRRRVLRHQQLRQGKGFVTLECPRDLDQLEIPRGCSLLLECLSNLCANECFGPRGFAGAEERILSGLQRLCQRTELVIIVTNELFSDGVEYPGETMDYLQLLAGLNRSLAGQAEEVYEIVCGLPIRWKGAAK